MMPWGWRRPQALRVWAGAFVLLASLGAGPALAADPPPRFAVPVDCEMGDRCFVQNYVDMGPGEEAFDQTCGPLTYQGHKGVDIRTLGLAEMDAGVPVIAAAPGVVKGLRDGMEDISFREGGLLGIKGREAGNGVVVDHGGGWETLYGHMKKGSIAVEVGQLVGTGSRLGEIGLSGKTEFPHLHFQVMKDGETVDPYTGLSMESGCEEKGQPMWTEAAAEAMRYRAGGLLGAGFVDHKPEIEELLTREAPVESLPTDAPALVLWTISWGLRGGDKENVLLLDPEGETLAAAEGEVPSDKARWFRFVGRKRPDQGWTPGTYRGIYKVEREGAVIIDVAREIVIQ